MILRYGVLSQKPAIFKSLTGLTVALFDELVWDLAPAYAQATVARRTRPGRQRAVGAGHPYRLPPGDEFLLTVLWLRHYWTQEALGYFFGVSDTTVLRAIGRVLPVLEAAGRDTMRTNPPSRRQRYGVAEALRAYPELADLDDEARVVDSFEQRVQRPTDQAEADRHYSGKKKAHTLKTQIVVQLGTGNVQEVAPFTGRFFRQQGKGEGRDHRGGRRSAPGSRTARVQGGTGR
jgi:DDE superfamily endonuclease